MQATRQEILDYLRRQGQATVKQLHTHLDLTSTGVRQHLTVLEREGLVDSHEERGRVGRPALVYALSEAGDELYPKRYEQLANFLLEEVRELAGGEALQTLLKRVAHRFAEPYRAQLEGKSIPERVSEAAQIIRDRGCEARSVKDGDDWLIVQSACPFPKVANANSCVCAMDVEFVRQLVGADVRLATSMVRGDRACTYRIRQAQPGSSRR